VSDWGLTQDGAVATLTIDCQGASVNTLNMANLLQLKTLLEQIDHTESIKTLLIRSAKSKMFVAGADIALIQEISTEDEAFRLVQEGQAVLNALENCQATTVAIINGPCLGGGLELALACNFRVSTTDTKVLLGLPEVKLGILPGFGGTQRLPRLIGLRSALDLILAGKLISAEKAAKIGLVDAIVNEAFLEHQLPSILSSFSNSKYLKSIYKKRGLRGWLEITFMGRLILFGMAKKTVLRQTKGHYPAPLEVLRVMKSTVFGSLARRLKIEARGFAKLAPTPESKSLIRLFFLQESFKKYTGVDGDHSVAPLSSAGVLGAGLMGGGISWLFLNQDIPVRLKDIKWSFIEQAYQTAGDIFQERVKRRRLSKIEKGLKMGRLTSTLSLDGFEHSDIIVEAVPEDMALKKQVFADLESVVSSQTILASNTSALSISEMASDLKHPERFIGMHFFSPVHKMPLVEVIRGEKTNDETVYQVVTLAKRCGKTPVVVQNCPGFLVNRILMPYVNEAIYLASQGVSIDRIDRLAVKFGMPVGPLTLADEVGLDVGYKVSKILRDGYGERMNLPPAFETLFSQEAPLLGRKSGEGFYTYQGKKKEVSAKMQGYMTSEQSAKEKISDEECVDRLILIMLNEASRCLDESVVESAGHLDMAMIMGTGFPPFRGGLWAYAEARGFANCVERLTEFSARYGTRFEASAYLKKAINNGVTNT